LIAHLKDFNEVNNLILDGRFFQASTLLLKKDKDNLLDACRGLSKEGMLYLVGVIGL